MKAIEVFAEKGYHETTVDEIADNLNVAKGTIYYHYKNKKQLYLALINEGFATLKGRVFEIVEGSGNAEEKLKRLIQVQVDFFQEYSNITFIFLREFYGNVINRHELTAILNEYLDLIAGILNEGQENGQFRPLETEVTTFMIFGAVAVSTLNHLHQPAGLTPELFLKNVIEGIFYGIKGVERQK